MGGKLYHYQNVARLAERLKKYETEIDKNRSSSKLPESGNTRKEDI